MRYPGGPFTDDHTADYYSFGAPEAIAIMPIEAGPAYENDPNDPEVTHKDEGGDQKEKDANGQETVKKMRPKCTVSLFFMI